MAIKVRATRLGFYANRRRRPGAEFEVNDPKELGSWMEVVEEPKPARKSPPRSSEG
jgi:hypothetical protein